MGKQIKLLSIFPIILTFSLFIGMMSNLFDLHNPSTSALVILLSTSIILIYYFYRNRLQLSQRLLKKWLVVDLSLIFIIQLLVLHFLPASVFHDPFRVLSQAELISHHQYNWSTSTYFWRYPNNVSLVFLLAKWLQLTNVLNLTTNTSLHLLSIIFLDSFIGLTLLIAIKKAAHSMFSLLLMLFFLISPFAYTYYLQVFYSDLPILLFFIDYIYYSRTLVSVNTLSENNRWLDFVHYDVYRSAYQTELDSHCCCDRYFRTRITFG